MPDWLLILTLILLGYILLAIEILIIPGFGIMGISGFIALILACYFAYAKLSPLLGAVVSVGSLILIVISWRLLPKTAAWKRLRLDSHETKEGGFHPFKANLKGLMNKEGTTLSPLRPIGICLINGKRVDAFSEGGLFIEKDKRVLVTKVEGNRVVVKMKP